jgi:predicted AlkP superfamily phosphohydrolase/phosphomutase
MNLLVIGIDCGDLNVFRSFDMPFMHALIGESVTHPIVQHPLERGWAAMLTGERPSETRALFMKPKMDGSRDLTIKYSLSEMLENQRITPLWTAIQAAGRKVGFMNIPTTYPAPEVEGFFVSGAGGGVNKVEGVPEQMCSPKSIVNLLNKNDYVIDYRIGTSPIDSISEFMGRINKMMEKRACSYIQLAKDDAIDFGFLVFRATTELHYVAMSEISTYLRSGMTETPEWKDLLIEHYRKLDNVLKMLFEELNPKQYMIVSDHGVVPYLYRGNVDAFLLDRGYMSSGGVIGNTIRRLGQKIIRGDIGRVKLNSIFARSGDRKKAKAFGNAYLQGAYINDRRRFQGVVAEGEVDALVDEICADFNRSVESSRWAMTAYPYRRDFIGSKYFDYLPDIWIDAPDTVFFDGKWGPLIEENNRFAPLPNLRKVTNGMHSGQKGRNAMLVTDKVTAGLCASTDRYDLTLVNKLSLRAMGCAART